MRPFEAVRTALEAHDCPPKGNEQRGMESRCPAHDDRNPSLSVGIGKNGRALIKCHAGCSQEDVVGALGLTMADLFERNGDREIVDTYDYVDEHRELLFQVVRFAAKDFRQRKPDGVGGWEWKLGNTRRVLYRLPRLLEAVERSEDVMIVEGEKDADRLHALGIAATCNPMGAGKWRDDYREPLRGAKVTIVADRDDPGREHARQIARSLEGVAAEIDIVEPAVGKDMSDHLAAGKSIAELVEVSPRRDIPPPATAELLDEIRGFIVRFVVLPSDAAADLLALWVLHTHALEAAWATPYLRIVSATPDSGKTLLLEILATLCRRGWHAVNPSAAVLYRRVDRDTPTLLLDEMDNFPLDDRRDAVAILNTGYKRGTTVDRCKENGDLQSFASYCPKAYAGLDVRSIVPALLSRSITIRMERKVSSEKVDMWIAPLVEPEATVLRERCEAWAAQHVGALADHRPDLLGLINRAAEVWWPLLSIAEVGGDEWHARAKAAVKELASGGDETDEKPDQVLLLADIRDAFGAERTISTDSLLAYLNGLDESPWGARRRSEGLDARGLAKMLRPFKVQPKAVRVADKTPRGYHVDQFGDAFARYLPEAQQAQQAQHPAPGLERNVADVADVADIQTPTRARREETLGAAWKRLERERGVAWPNSPSP
jgi:5S rRNA maturation endonuclease (ribonuclease M5)